MNNMNIEFTKNQSINKMPSQQLLWKNEIKVLKKSLAGLGSAPVCRENVTHGPSLAGVYR